MTITAYMFNGDGTVPKCPRRFALRMVKSNTGGDLWNAETFWSCPSDPTTGLASITAILNASYQASLDGINWTPTFIAATDPIELTELVGYFHRTIQ